MSASKWSAHLWASSQLLVGFLGVVANALQLVFIRRKGEWRSVFTLTLLSLCIADLIASLMIMCMGCSGLLVAENVSTDQWYGAVAITGVTFSAYTSNYHILFIAVQRLCAVIYPLRFKRIFTLQRSAVVLICIWVISAGFNALKLLFPNFFKHSSACAIIIGGAILILLYSVLCYKIRKRSEYQINRHRRSNWRAVVHSFAVMIIYVLCSVSLALAKLLPSIPHKSVGYETAFLLFELNPLLDSLLYFFVSFCRSKQTSSSCSRIAPNLDNKTPVRRTSVEK